MSHLGQGVILGVLHMPLVCPDGAVVAYAWKRQLAGQAGASAVDRTRFIFVVLGNV